MDGELHNIVTMSDSDVTEDSTIPGGDPSPEKLHRSTSNRKIAGVAGGIGERFDIDANVVRVIFAVLTLVGGLGAAIYLVLWSCVPLSGVQEGEQVGLAKEGGHRWSFRALVLLGGVLCLGLIFLSVALNGPNIGRGLGLFWLVFLAVLAVAALRGPGRFRFGRFLLGLLIAMVSLAILASGGVLAYVAASGVPMTGGIGQRIYQPSSVAEVQNQYHLAIGTLNVDLRGVDFRDDSISIVATVAIGSLSVEVPPGVQVDLNAQSGTGVVEYPDGRQSFYFSGKSKSSTSYLHLTVRVGIGKVQLYRLSPGAPVGWPLGALVAPQPPTPGP
jgi:phage shock protein PspC (stress-responsive transcriptional regulator)